MARAASCRWAHEKKSILIRDIKATALSKKMVDKQRSHLLCPSQKSSFGCRSPPSTDRKHRHVLVGMAVWAEVKVTTWPIASGGRRRNIQSTGTLAEVDVAFSSSAPDSNCRRVAPSVRLPAASSTLLAIRGGTATPNTEDYASRPR